MITLFIATLAIMAQDMPQTMDQAPEPPSKSARKQLQRGISNMGDMYETMGRCVGSMSPSEVQAILAPAQDQPDVGPYLLQRFEKGFRHPKDDAWCHKNAG